MTSPAPHSRLALDNVRVFDGHGLTAPETVVIDGPIIGADATGARHLDADGAILLPGFIDAHVHLHDLQTPQVLAAHGVTTSLDMTAAPDLVAALRNGPYADSLRSAVLPVVGPGSAHARALGEQVIIHAPEQAEDAVAQRIKDGCDYVKLVLEEPGHGGPGTATASAVVAAAHARAFLVIAHAATPGAYTIALDAGADIITHIPVAGPLPQHDIDRMAAGPAAAVPTLGMMQGYAEIAGDAADFEHALTNVAALHAAGVPILAGTDANAIPVSPVRPPFGASLHRELELLVRAGLSTADALRAATTGPARAFGLTDRGAITPGLRADLVLLDGDPLADITATRSIRRIWRAGIDQPVEPHAPNTFG
ncbi:amidohydrolase family protein [Nocardia huaxiensis]|uniref:amidohydrolase family protein n=1 Tax=Nocardia huaxiensis TaxID=2755382 RepID=UPI001E2BB41E|nr:amidohydrolase family protein [Nocardia huaxiensis]UFS97779.1 amidohydrolase family protein [Nocardia huaxiensis]